MLVIIFKIFSTKILTCNQLICYCYKKCEKKVSNTCNISEKHIGISFAQPEQPDSSGWHPDSWITQFFGFFFWKVLKYWLCYLECCFWVLKHSPELHLLSFASIFFISSHPSLSASVSGVWTHHVVNSMNFSISHVEEASHMCYLTAHSFFSLPWTQKLVVFLLHSEKKNYHVYSCSVSFPVAYFLTEEIGLQYMPHLEWRTSITALNTWR